MRPVADSIHQAMFDGIVLNVVHMPGEIVVVTDDVFPISPLPKRKLTVFMAFGVDALLIKQLLKYPLMRRHRAEKSASFGGNVRTACR
jgi:hypothetical protein